MNAWEKLMRRHWLSIPRRETTQTIRFVFSAPQITGDLNHVRCPQWKSGSVVQVRLGPRSYSHQSCQSGSDTCMPAALSCFVVVLTRMEVKRRRVAQSVRSIDEWGKRQTLPGVRTPVSTSERMGSVPSTNSSLKRKSVGC